MTPARVLPLRGISLPGAVGGADPWRRAGQRVASLDGRRAVLLALGLGALSALALPPFSLIPVLWVAIPGLLWLIDGAGSMRRAALLGFVFGFGHHLVGLYWVTEAILIEAARYWWFVPLAVPGLSAILAPFIAVPCALATLAPRGWRRALALAGLWVLADLARQYIGTGFPWNPFGSVWALPGFAGVVMLQPAAWIGTPGLTLATILLAAAPILGWTGLAGSLAALVLWVGFGLVRLDRPVPPATGDHVVLVQGDIPEGQKMDQARAASIFDRYLALTRDGVATAEALPHPGQLVVVWPESASPYWLGEEPVARQEIARAMAPAAYALVGSIRLPGGLPPAPGPLPRGTRPYNSLFAIGPDGAIAGTYDKWHLVPFGEYQPRWALLPIQIVPGGGFAFGSGPRTLALQGIPPVGPLICYEAIFPAQVVDENDRPDWMVNITNDAWFGDSSGPRQHLAAARMRAVEEGLPLLRAANTGITAAFDAHGRELGRIGLDRAGVLVVALPPPLPPTPFSRWGLVIPGLLALASIAAGGGLMHKRILHR